MTARIKLEPGHRVMFQCNLETILDDGMRGTVVEDRDDWAFDNLIPVEWDDWTGGWSNGDDPLGGECWAVRHKYLRKLPTKVKR